MELGDAHTRVLSPRQYANYKDKQTVGTGLSLARLNGDTVRQDFAPVNVHSLENTSRRAASSCSRVTRSKSFLASV